MKRSCKAEDILKDDCYAFGTNIVKTLTLDEAFQYPVTAVPSSVTTPDGDLRHSEKAFKRNFLNNNSNATTQQIAYQ